LFCHTKRILSAYTFVICLKDRIILNDIIKCCIVNLRFTATTIKRCFMLLMPVYSLRMSRIVFTNHLYQRTERSATNSLLIRIKVLASIHFRSRKTRLMSCYAFPGRWLLPSLLYNCYNLSTFLSLNIQWKSLSNNLGCFPLDNRPSHLLSDSTKN